MSGVLEQCVLPLVLVAEHGHLVVDDDLLQVRCARVGKFFIKILSMSIAKKNFFKQVRVIMPQTGFGMSSQEQRLSSVYVLGGNSIDFLLARVLAQ